MSSPRTCITGAVLFGSAVLAGCSGASAGDDDESGAPLVTPTLQSVSAQAQEVFADPGTAFETVPSTTPGIAEWTIYASPNGMVAEGADANGATRAELAMLSVSDGKRLQITGNSYVYADTLATTPEDLVNGLLRDIDALSPATDAVNSDVFQLDDGPLVSSPDAGVVKMSAMQAIVKACGTTAGGLIKGGFVATGGLLVGATMEATCPWTFGGGCVGGAAVAAAGNSYAAGQICPNLPTGMWGAIKSIVTPAPVH